ncbi:MAG: hypothetical protein ACRDZQ_01945 [Acidimicrobiales bacterium]
MSRPGSTWKALLASVAAAFTSPSFTLFLELTSAWVCVTGRRTVTGMISVMDPATRGAHDAYHRFVRAGAWSLDALWVGGHGGDGGRGGGPFLARRAARLLVGRHVVPPPGPQGK